MRDSSWASKEICSTYAKKELFNTLGGQVCLICHVCFLNADWKVKKHMDKAKRDLKKGSERSAYCFRVFFPLISLFPLLIHSLFDFLHFNIVI